jgi:mRNA interferase RelE/StbE
VPDAYELQLERGARKSLDALPDVHYHRIREAVDRLASEPRPRGCVKLRGMAPTWRIRVGNYRVIYAIFDRERIVKIIEVLPRTTQTYERM